MCEKFRIFILYTFSLSQSVLCSFYTDYISLTLPHHHPFHKENTQGDHQNVIYFSIIFTTYLEQVEALLSSTRVVLRSYFRKLSTRHHLKHKFHRKELQKHNSNRIPESTFYRARYREVVTEHKLRIVNLLHNTNCVLAPLINDVQRDVV